MTMYLIQMTLTIMTIIIPPAFVDSIIPIADSTTIVMPMSIIIIMTKLMQAPLFMSLMTIIALSAVGGIGMARPSVLAGVGVLVESMAVGAIATIGDLGTSTIIMVGDTMVGAITVGADAITTIGATVMAGVDITIGATITMDIGIIGMPPTIPATASKEMSIRPAMTVPAAA